MHTLKHLLVGQIRCIYSCPFISIKEHFEPIPFETKSVQTLFETCWFKGEIPMTCKNQASVATLVFEQVKEFDCKNVSY